MSPTLTSSLPHTLTPTQPHLQSPINSSSLKYHAVRRSTVVVHGEQLVIRKLVVAGIVSAEKTYIDCLVAMKEVSLASILRAKGPLGPLVHPPRAFKTLPVNHIFSVLTQRAKCPPPPSCKPIVYIVPCAFWQIMYTCTYAVLL